MRTWMAIQDKQFVGEETVLSLNGVLGVPGLCSLKPTEVVSVPMWR
jgi:hypothetical protein